MLKVTKAINQKWIEQLKVIENVAEELNQSNGNSDTQKEDIQHITNSVALVRGRTIRTGRQPPVGEVSGNFLRIEGCHVVSATDPHGR